ncbi:phosphonate ABC transporter substrate-binding protein [Mesorhizobium sp. M7A.F.Ca.US.001.04.1.1]|uniref:substrate-binding domain-containing protein n=1 Tax=unclassified Mesorhizobium TaxID=325217 RepID=UPI000FCB5279|nr:MULTISPECIES: PhnD/SsuA/transferrin family substrate-binding protein [unclassified Mesorhizobium]RUY21468.1 phosphonate ABC transporter substrate-binding protein [Mesorhizobium sp. M7A.F.Ca.US.001.04.2.1]RUY34602.1 phosphonate ABC transporter substrate-binding protein [Mesorhizobium sp. M7A.F.Ca.US.001.04.1.1]
MPTQIEPGRRGILKAALGGLALLSLPRISQAEIQPFQFGLTPVFLSNDLELLGHLRAYLMSKLGSPVELVTRRTYQEITALLVSGQIHSAWICGYPYVQYKADLDLVATPVWHGKPLYQSYLISAAGRAVEDWTGLKGDVHAFSDPDSNSGFLVTRTLLAKNKLLPEGFFSRSFFTYGHRNVVRAVASGLAQSGSVDGYVYEVMRETDPDLIKQTKIVRRSDWLGFPPVASPKSLAGDTRVKALQQALVLMKDDPEGKKVLDLLRLDGFLATDPSLFDTIAAEVEIVRQFG